MRWLFVTGDNPYEGDTGYYKASRDYLDVILSDDESRIRVLTLDSKSKAPKDLRNVELDSVCCLRRMPKRIIQGFSLLSWTSATVWQFKPKAGKRALFESVDRWKPDVVVFNGIRAGWLIARCSTNKLPLTFFVAHNPEAKSLKSSADYERRWLLRQAIKLEAIKMSFLEKKILERADGIVVQTEEDSARLEELCRPLPKCLVLPPRLSVPPRSGEDLPNSQNSLLLVGSFRWLPKRRDAEWIVKSVFPLVKENIPNAKFSIVGSGADILEPLVRPGIEIYSDVPDVAPYYSGMPVFVVADRQLGGIKNKTVEAASHGLAIVSTKAGAEGTGLVNGESCVITDNAEEFAGAIIKFLRDPKKRDKFGKNAYETVLNRFDRKSNAARFHSFARILACNASDR